MDRKEKLTIERWELKDVIDVFRTKAYNRLVYIYKGEEFDYKKFSEFYFWSKQVPKLKE